MLQKQTYLHQLVTYLSQKQLVFNAYTMTE